MADGTTVSEREAEGIAVSEAEEGDALSEKVDEEFAVTCGVGAIVIGEIVGARVIGARD